MRGPKPSRKAPSISMMRPLLTAGVAGSGVALYALILFWPWTTALKELAAPLTP